MMRYVIGNKSIKINYANKVIYNCKKACKKTDQDRLEYLYDGQVDANGKEDGVGRC